jgi:hypothetical protein
MAASVHSGVMQHLPPDFAEDLAQVLEPAHRGAAAGIIKAASALDDEGLRTFLELFAQRVRESEKPITHTELKGFLVASKRSSRPPGL